MKKYQTLLIECEKGVLPHEIVKKVSSCFKYNRRLFEIFSLEPERIKTKKTKELYEHLGLDRFAYSYILPHLKNPDYPQNSNYPGPKWHSISNLDSNWENGNPGVNDDVDEKSFFDIVDFCGILKNTEVTSFMVGIDEIQWRGESVDHGTYGRKKAKTAFDIGEGYLSNCILISKTSFQKPNLIVRLSCESKYRNLDAVNELIDSIGKVKLEKEQYAPSNEAEREEWERAFENTEIKINRFKSELPALIDNLPNEVKELVLVEKVGGTTRVLPYPKDKINVRKIENGILACDGWEIKNKDLLFRTTVTSKTINGIEYKTCIDTLHGGHHLQLLFSCSSPMFEFGVNSSYTAYPVDEEQARNYLRNAKVLRDAFVETVSAI